MKVTVFPGPTVRGYHGQIGEKEDKYHGPHTDLSTLLDKAYGTDAHFVPYWTPGASRTPRYTLAGISAIEPDEVPPMLGYLVFDVDNPGHVKWKDVEDPNALLDPLTEALDSHTLTQGCGFYLTSGGARLIVQLRDAVPLNLAASLIGQAFTALEGVIPGLDPLKDPTRLFRCPNVQRVALGPDGKPAGTPYTVTANTILPGVRSTMPSAPTAWVPPKALVQGVRVQRALAHRQAAKPVSEFTSPKSKPGKMALRGLDKHHPALYSVLLGGLPLYEEPEGRHGAIVQAVGKVVRALDLKVPSDVIGLLGHSTWQMIAAFPEDPRAAQWWTELHQVTDWVLDHKAGERVALKEEQQHAAEQRAEVLSDLADHLDVMPGTARKCLVLKGAKAYFCWSPEQGTYVGEWDGDTIVCGIRDNLAGVIDIDRRNKEGAATGVKSTSELMRHYGRQISEVVYDYKTDGGQYDVAMDQLRLCVAKKVRRPPVFHQDIQTFLELWGPKMVDWAAAFYRVDQPCAAIYLDGERGAGKSLLVKLFSQALAGVKVPLESLSGQFNEKLRRSWFVVADEGIQWPDKTDPSILLRRLTGESSRSLAQKYRADTELDGYARVMFAANNSNILQFRQALGGRDIAAVTERVIYMAGKNSAAIAEHLRQVRSAYAKAQGFEALNVNAPNVFEDLWMKAGHFLEHLAWLEQNHTWERGYRLLVEGASSEWSEGLKVRHGAQYPILAAIAQACTQAGRVEGKPVVLCNGAAWVNVRGLCADWEFLSTDPAESQRNVKRALATLGDDRKERVKGPLGNAHYWAVPIDMVVRVADEVGLALDYDEGAANPLEVLAERTWEQVREEIPT